MKIIVHWSPDAVEDLERIYNRVLKRTFSENLAKNVVEDIYNTAVNIKFVHQYQVDAYLDEPYRRMVVRHFKIIYRPINNSEIRILQIFDTFQNYNKLREYYL